MTTELDIHTLARRLREVFPGEHTAIAVSIDNFAGGNNKVAWYAYGAKRGKPVSPDFTEIDELTEWLEANWLKEVGK